MSIDYRDKNAMYQHLLEQEYCIFNVTVNANATPASKVLESDMPGVAVLRCQGETAAADAIESGISWTAPVDANGTCGLLLDDQCKKIYQVNVTPSTGTVSVTSGISAGGRIYLNLDSNQDFSTTSVTFLVEVKYLIKNA